MLLPKFQRLDSLRQVVAVPSGGPQWTPAEEELLALGMLRAGTQFPAIAALLLPPFTPDELAAHVQRRCGQKNNNLVKVCAPYALHNPTMLHPCPSSPSHPSLCQGRHACECHAAGSVL